jgi:FKBP-type peptidyl-prolyl cis-trans isomerase FklB
MRNFILILIALIFTVFIGCDESKTSKIKTSQDSLKKPVSLNDRFSYMVGTTMGENFKRDSVYDVNYEYLIAGIEDILYERESPLLDRMELDSTSEEIQKILDARNKRKILRDRRLKDANRKEAFEFLEKNKKEPGVVTLPSGLQYKVIEKGQGGESPKVGDYIKIHVKAKFLNGKEFDNSYERGEPVYLQMMDGLLKSWYESLELMKKGSKWKLFSPPELAFGSQGSDAIPPNKLVLFELELLDFQKDPFPENKKPILPPEMQQEM